MLPMLTSLMIAWALSATGDPGPSSLQAQISPSPCPEFPTTPSVGLLTPHDPDRPVDIFWESDPDEDDDSSTDESLLNEERFGGGSIASVASGVLRGSWAIRRAVPRSPILRC